MQRITRFFVPALIAATALLAANNAFAADHGHDRDTRASTNLHIGVTASHADSRLHRGHGGHKGTRHGGHDRYSRYHRGCRKVSKHGYYHGREAKIGGTMCYDRYGEPYIVQGSRYVIHYY